MSEWGINYSLRGAPHMFIYSHGPVRRECLGARTFEHTRVSVVTVWTYIELRMNWSANEPQ
eukprot:5928962-Pyramimonas_sp.AAC.1